MPETNALIAMPAKRDDACKRRSPTELLLPQPTKPWKLPLAEARKKAPDWLKLVIRT